MSVDAIGYLRSDISGANQALDEAQVREYARCHGYNLRKTIVFGTHTDDPERRLGVVQDRMDGICAVIVPSVRHFGVEIPAHIRDRADVLAVSEPTGLTALIDRAAAGQ